MLIDISFSTDPVPLLSSLRAQQPATLQLRCRKPTCPAEENYLLLFEEFNPTIEFAELEAVPGPYDSGRLAIPTGPVLPVTGEFLQGLCDYTVLNRDKATEKHVWVAAVCPAERQLLIEEPWPDNVFEAQSLFIYPTGHTCTSNHVFSRVWPKLRLIIFHNIDHSLDYKPISKFLESHPNVWVWAENAVRWHPRIRCVPILQPNRIWRGGSLDYDPPVDFSRKEDRPIDICVPHWSITHDIRIQWRKEVNALSSPRIFRAAQLPQKDYLNFLPECRAMVCPPGNGHDTHRVWECLTMGVWPIVHDNAHTQLLLRQYPSLGLLAIDSPEDLDAGLEIPPGLPPFHPLLIREYWRVLFESHMD